MKTLTDYDNGMSNDPFGTGKKVVFKILFFMLLIGGIIWCIDMALTPIQTGKDVIQKTLNADNVLQNYEWFKQQYNDYLAIEQKIFDADSAVKDFKAVAGNRKDWSFEDKNEYTRLSSISQGLRYQKADIIGKYNARSSMKNREVFKSNDLPYSLK